MSAWQELRARIWDECGGSCAYCRKPLHPLRDFTVDHVHPRSRGGGDDLGNLVACCRACNSEKRAKTPVEWKGQAMAGKATDEPNQIALALLESLFSPNEMDQNWESANVVDGLFAIARSIRALAKAVDRLAGDDQPSNGNGENGRGAGSIVLRSLADVDVKPR